MNGKKEKFDKLQNAKQAALELGLNKVLIDFVCSKVELNFDTKCLDEDIQIGH